MQNESYVEQRRLLKAEAKSMLCKVVNHLDQLEMIDVLQRLGVAYHFKDEIKNMLDNIYNMEAFKGENNLHATALKFRLLRQHGYDISTGFLISLTPNLIKEDSFLPLEQSCYANRKRIFLTQLFNFT